MSHPENLDLSLGFVLEKSHIRGRLVRLHHVVNNIISKHAYPYKIGHLLAELIVAAVGLRSLLKFEGIFTLQTKGRGPIQLAVVDVTSDGNTRGYVQYDEAQLTGSKSQNLAHLLGTGYLAFIVDPLKGRDRYEGLVELTEDDLSANLEYYFEQSEQLESRVRIAVDYEDGKWNATALILQKMPEKDMSPEEEEEAWNHIDALLRTLGRQEFLDFSHEPETLLFRLFHELELSLFPPTHFQAKCRCDRERIQSFLSSLAPEEIEEFVINNQIDVTCEFCNHTYVFERKDVHTLH
ncbi:Hsp33 family molecular chaperone HslO [Candidatus Bealeia paramacronuclearis]|uniref:Hsp33 family molecular chaperone HslO n=1 Tax=Candidatus Bealeia paramacronuclearis TaxID=1921001 RepID=A0ABZ2C2V2_9PROT|nr:Hsp33 family molecular chaperone HslO [Candidatus Bealeia paramacronuclearis]